MDANRKRKEHNDANDDVCVVVKRAKSNVADVAAHYNNVQESTVTSRRQDSLFQLRSFNNWVKSVLINIALSRVRAVFGSTTAINVIDIACGKGGDLMKWKHGQVAHVDCVDVADVSLEQARRRYEEMKQRHNNSK